ncbi:MAG: inorganic diphosphatase [Candidatus Promineifilaceae bacterium]|nr:inorganic diphosphatase [Anaerolineaceae bacterium]
MAKDYATKYIGEIVTVKMDRPMGSRHPRWGFFYPVNYGELPKTKAPDGDSIDAYVLGVFEPVDEFTGLCIAVIHRLDDDDDKLIVVPEGTTYSDEQILALTEFQERFFTPRIVRKKSH